MYERCEGDRVIRRYTHGGSRPPRDEGWGERRSDPGWIFQSYTPTLYVTTPNVNPGPVLGCVTSSYIRLGRLNYISAWRVKLCAFAPEKEICG
jgi:hypothetical protein